MKISDFFSTFNISASGLSAEKRRLAITAENIANANTTRTAEGTAYKRKVMIQEVLSERSHFMDSLRRAEVNLKTSQSGHLPMSNYTPGDITADGFSDIETKVEEQNQFKEVYDPDHPDADGNGIVRFPNVNVVAEMLELISASRTYEANITVMNATKNLAKKSLEI
jgi:flagellar basal-body rod protein FlgC